MTDADVLIVGAGIAGLSAAWCARQAGRDVTVVDVGAHRASDLPLALVNPLRGRAGRLVADGVQGVQATFALVDALRADGHAIDGARGLYRPLIDVAPDALHEAFWRTRLAGRVAFDWHAAAPSSLGLAGSVPCLYVHDAGWIAPRGLLDALRSGSGATFVEGRATARRDAVELGGSTVTARSILWCGGAWGGALLERDQAGDALYKPGSLVAVDARLTAEPLSFGLYAAPFDGGTLVGPTRENSSAVFPDEPVSPDVVAHLGERIARVFGTTAAARESWRGVRLARLSSAAGAALDGVPTLTSLGSRGFLMAPLLAARWARSL